MALEQPPGPAAAISAQEVVRGLLAHTKLIVAGTAVCVVVGVIVALVSPKRFESTAILLHLPSPVKEAEDRDKQPVGLFPRILDVQDYRVLLSSDGVLAKVTERLRADLPAGEVERIAPPSRIREATQVTITVVEKTAYSSAYSPAVTLRASGRTPEVARALAQAWAEVAVEESAAFYQTGKGAQIDFLTQRVASVEDELERILAEQEANEAEYDPDAARVRLTTVTELLGLLEEKLADARAEAEGYGQEAAELRTRMEEMPEKVELRQSPPMTALFLEQALGKGADGANPQEELGGYTFEAINPIRTEAGTFLAEADKLHRGFAERQRSLEQSIARLTEELDRERALFAKHNHNRKRLEHQEKAVGRNYLTVTDRLTQAKIADMEQAGLGDLKIASPAVLPDEKVAPQRKLIVVVAALLGLCVSCLVTLVRVIAGQA